MALPPALLAPLQRLLLLHGASSPGAAAPSVPRDAAADSLAPPLPARRPPPTWLPSVRAQLPSAAARLRAAIASLPAPPCTAPVPPSLLLPALLLCLRAGVAVMGTRSSEMVAVATLLLLVALAGLAAGGDIVHQDNEAPKIPSCSNNFILVIYC